MPSTKIVVGSKLTLPLPAPYNLTVNPPSIATVTYSRTDVTVEAVSPGVGTITIDSGTDWHLAFDVEVVNPATIPVAMLRRQPA